MQMLRLLARLSLALAAAAAIAGCTTANRADISAVSTRIQAGSAKATLAPLEFVSFCMHNGGQCRPAGQPSAVVEASPENLAVIEEVNRQVNLRIRPSSASTDWRINPASGNCNDYVVSKRYELLQRGFPSSALLINVVTTASGEGHLVLVVKTDRRDLVLDNLTSTIRGVNAGRIPGQRGGVKAGHWRRGRTICKGPRSGPSAYRRVRF